MINAANRWLKLPEEPAAPKVSDEHYEVGEPPVCFVIDEDTAHRHFMSLVLQGHGIETGLFPNPTTLASGLRRRRPDLVFLDVPALCGYAMEAIRILADTSYRGPIQLMSAADVAGIDAVRQLGERHGLRLLPPVSKPLERPVIKRVVQEQKLDFPVSLSRQVELAMALRENWIEFWYQPKIDLRRKQLSGVELFARVRHPEYGIMPPSAFMETADAESLVALTQRSILDALSTCRKFSDAGINFRLAINVPIGALTKLPLPQIIRENRPRSENWPGLILDITEDEIASDFSLVRELHAQLEPCGVALAIDDFGRGYLSLARLQELPHLVEFKLDRAFVADCAADQGRAALCKSVINVAHNCGARAIGVGIEKAADANALAQMGCDLGQGYLFAQPMAEERFHALLRQRAERPARQAPALVE